MIDLAIAWMRRDPAWRNLLAAYDGAEPVPAPPDEAPAGWVTRLSEVEGIPPQEISRIHGKLIAFGLLEFELAGRSAGVRYRVTRDGRAILRGEPVEKIGEADRAADEPNECRVARAARSSFGSQPATHEL